MLSRRSDTWDMANTTPIVLDLLQNGMLPKGRAFIPGCGSGYDVVAIAGPDRYVVGLDVSSTAIKNAKELDDQVSGPPYNNSIADYAEVLNPEGFKMISIVDNDIAFKFRMGKEKLAKWKQCSSNSTP